MINNRYLTEARARRIGRIMALRGGRYIGGAHSDRYMAAPTRMGWAILDCIYDEDANGERRPIHWLWFAPTMDDVLGVIND